MPTSSCRRMRAISAVASSGVDVPIATNVAPMTNSLSPNRWAMSLAPKTISLPAAISRAKPIEVSTGARRRPETSPAGLPRQRRRSSVRMIVTNHSANPPRGSPRPGARRRSIDQHEAESHRRRDGAGELPRHLARMTASGPNSKRDAEDQRHIDDIAAERIAEEISGSSASAELMATVSSGLDVAKAATVAAITLGRNAGGAGNPDRAAHEEFAPAGGAQQTQREREIGDRGR